MATPEVIGTPPPGFLLSMNNQARYADAFTTVRAVGERATRFFNEAWILGNDGLLRYMNHALETVPLVGPQEEEAYAKWFAKDIPTMVQAGLERPLLKRTDWAELSRIGDPAAYIVGVFERKRPEVLNPRNTSAMKAAFTAYSVFAGGIHKYRNFEDV